MSNYTKVTDFAAKDSLLTGDPNKIIKGADFDAEFNSIQTSIATKADGNNPSITNGTINSTTIGATNPSSIVGTSVTSTLGFTGNLTGDVTGDLTGNVTAATGTTTLNDLTVGGSVTGTLNTADLNITGSIAVSGTVDGREVATDGSKLDGIEYGATGDQTAAEIKTAYESNADTNVLTDAEKTLLGTIETGADVTDATNVDAAGAVMNSDATTASMSFVIDEDSFTSNLDTKVPTQQSVKAYVDATVVSIGGLTIDGTVATGEFGVFTSASTIGGQTPTEVRASLDLEVGTDVQAHDADLDAIAALTPTDGHFLQYSGGTWTSAEVQTDPTLGTLTKTFVSNESATITLSSSLTDVPVVSVTKEIPQTSTTNNSWDVNSTEENYTRTNSAPATTLDFNIHPESASYNNVSFSAAAQASDPEGIQFSADGTKMFVLNAADSSVYEYDLSTAFDVSTASYNSVSFSVATEESTPKALTFNNDGTKMFITGQGGDEVNEYVLSTAFDISTASASQVFDVSGQLIAPQGIAFSNDGTSMFVVGWSSDKVFQYDLTIAFDISTAAYTSKSITVSGQDPNPSAVAFNFDGTRMYILGYTNDIVHEYTLTTAFDLSTASYNTAFHTVSEETKPTGLAFSPRGGKMYVVGETNNVVYEYDVSGEVSALSLGTGSFSSADVGKTVEASGGVFVSTNANGRVVEVVAPSSYGQVASGDWGMYAVVYNAADGDLELSGYYPYFDISVASYTSKSFDVKSQESVPQGIAFDTNGSKMFIVGSNGDEVNEYALSTPFDVSTATFTQLFSVSGQEAVPTAIAFNTDGTKMFIVGDSGNDVNEYTLSVGFDLGSTVTFVDSFSVGSETTNPRGVAFNTDGTKMFIMSTDKVVEYNLSLAFDVSSSVFSQSFSTAVQENSAADVAFNADGTKMFVIGWSGTASVYEYDLSTGFDLSTAAFSQTSFSVNSEEQQPTGLAFDTLGLTLFVVGQNSDIVYQYSMGPDIIPTGYNAAHTKVSSDSTYWTDINSMTVDEDAGDGNVYYAVSTDDRTTWAVIDDTDGVRNIVRNSGGTWQYNSNTTYGSETWTTGTTNTELATLEEAMSVAVVDHYTITDVTFVDGFSVTTEDTNPSSIAFNSDGTKMFVLGYTGQDVNEYSLSSAYDVSTASYTQNFSVASKETQPWGINFNTDGTKMFVTGQASKDVHEYDLTTGFDVSTASFSQTLSLSLGTSVPVSIEFNSSGTLMYLLVSGTTDYVYRYTLSTGFDISTASASDQSFSVTTEETAPYGLVFNNDGTKFYIAGNTGDDITEYSLSTAYDLTTASATGVTFFPVSQTAQPVSMRWNGDGSKFFVLGLDTDEVYEYELNPTDNPNQMDKTQLEAVTDANHFTLGNDLDLAIVFNQTASGLAPSSDGVSINYDANTLEQGAVLGTDYNWDNPASDKVRITAIQAGNYKVRVV